MADEDMRAGMFLRSTLDFYQFLLSFCNKIVGVALLHHVGHKILDGTLDGSCWIGLLNRVSYRNSAEIRLKWSNWVLASSLATAKPVDAILLPDMFFFMFPRYYFTVWPVASTFRLSERSVVTISASVFIFSIIWSLLSLRVVGHSDVGFLSMLWLLSNSDKML